jgi:hypothetical protein
MRCGHASHPCAPNVIPFCCITLPWKSYLHPAVDWHAFAPWCQGWHDPLPALIPTLRSLPSFPLPCQGVDYWTIHAGVLLRHIPLTANRITGIVSAPPPPAHTPCGLACVCNTFRCPHDPQHVLTLLPPFSSSLHMVWTSGQPTLGFCCATFPSQPTASSELCSSKLHSCRHTAVARM